MSEVEHWKQPPLIDDWGCPYYGWAKTATGHVWWHEGKDSRRVPLRPVTPIPDPPPAEQT